MREDVFTLKLHADSVVVLLDMASTTTEEVGNVDRNDEQNGSATANPNSAALFWSRLRRTNSASLC
jgi:hypothetical protein